MLPLPTKFGLSVMLMCCGLYMVSMQAKSGLMLLILGLVFACLVMNLFAALRAARALRVQPPPAVRCTEGEAGPDAWLLRNDAALAGGFVEVSLAGRKLLRAGSMAPGEELFVAPENVFQRRGVYSFDRLRVTSSYPFGLVTAGSSLPLPGEMLVRPAVYECPVPPAAGFEPVVGGSFTGKNRAATGGNFHGIRPLQPQDPLKMIHWPSSAKGLGLQVREFDEELSGRTAIVLDCAVPGLEPEAQGLLLDAACRAAGSLGLAVLDAGNQLEFCRLGTPPEQLSVPPFTDGGLLLDALARARALPLPLTSVEIDIALAELPQRCALCFVLPRLHPAILDCVRRLAADRRNLLLCLPAGPAPDAETELPAELRVWRFASHGLLPEASQ